jgi:hypothetical protein
MGNKYGYSLAASEAAPGWIAEILSFHDELNL